MSSAPHTTSVGVRMRAITGPKSCRISPSAAIRSGLPPRIRCRSGANSSTMSGAGSRSRDVSERTCGDLAQHVGHARQHDAGGLGHPPQVVPEPGVAVQDARRVDDDQPAHLLRVHGRVKQRDRAAHGMADDVDRSRAVGRDHARQHRRVVGGRVLEVGLPGTAEPGQIEQHHPADASRAARARDTSRARRWCRGREPAPAAARRRARVPP